MRLSNLIRRVEDRIEPVVKSVVKDVRTAVAAVKANHIKPTEPANAE